MDKNMLKRWFNGLYGKLSPERQLEELEKLKDCVEELAEAKRQSFERNQTCCTICGCYSLTSQFKKEVKLDIRQDKKTVTGARRKAEYSQEIYFCPKCQKKFVHDEKFVRFTADN